ncbi:popeye domain-containing protein 3 isoform X2 [Panthera onca]
MLGLFSNRDQCPLGETRLCKLWSAAAARSIGSPTSWWPRRLLPGSSGAPAPARRPPPPPPSPCAPGRAPVPGPRPRRRAAPEWAAVTVRPGAGRAAAAGWAARSAPAGRSGLRRRPAGPSVLGWETSEGARPELGAGPGKERIRVTVDGEFLHYIFPFQFLDSPEWDSLRPTEEGIFQVTLTAETDCRYVSWRRKKLYLLFAQHRYISRLFSVLIGSDIADKLYALNDRVYTGKTYHYDIRLPNFYQMSSPKLPKSPLTEHFRNSRPYCDK